jgi:hypothetical protein
MQVPSHKDCMVNTLPKSAIAALLTTASAVVLAQGLQQRFAAMSDDERAGALARVMASNGRPCSQVTRTFAQGTAPDGLSFWSFSCLAGEDWQLVINPDSSIQFLPCKEIAERKLFTCFQKLGGR